MVEQQAAVDEEEKLAEETLRSYSTQAESERQQYAAVVQRYDETVTDKQEQFRLQLAKEVDLRIVRSLLGGDEVTLDAIKAVAEGRHSPDEMEFFKARFADSLAGSDQIYMRPNFCCSICGLETVTSILYTVYPGKRPFTVKDG